jgi:AcrR family transcriptional regulator
VVGETWRQRHHKATREEILAVARGVMLEEGIEGLGVRELARRTGFGPASLYTYFAGKAEIVTAITRESMRELEEYLDRVPDDLPSAERVVQLCRAYLAFADENPADLACIIEVGLRGGEASTVVVAGMEAVRRRMAAALSEGRQAPSKAGSSAGGDSAPPDTAAALGVGEVADGLLAQVHGVVVLRHAGVADVAEDAAEAIVRRWVAGLRRSGTSPA